MIKKDKEWDEIRERIEEVKAEIQEADEEGRIIQEELRIVREMAKIRVKKGRRSPEKPLYPREERDEFFNSSDLNLHNSQQSVDL